jgi:hypothetical protein
MHLSCTFRCMTCRGRASIMTAATVFAGAQLLLSLSHLQRRAPGFSYDLPVESITAIQTRKPVRIPEHILPRSTCFVTKSTKNAPFVHLSVYAVPRSAVQNDNCYIIGAGAHFCLSYRTTTTWAPGALVVLAAPHEQLQSVGPPRPRLEPVFRWAGPARVRWWGRRRPAPAAYS